MVQEFTRRVMCLVQEMNWMLERLRTTTWRSRRARSARLAAALRALLLSTGLGPRGLAAREDAVQMSLGPFWTL